MQINQVNFHLPVLKEKVVELLLTDKGGTYVDATLGGGGHALALLEALSLEATLVGIDVDEDALQYALNRLKDYKHRLIIRKENFKNLRSLFSNEGINQIHGILLDLGVSSFQIDTPQRGFSYTIPGPVDMRMDRTQKLSAHTVVNCYPEDKLRDIFKRYGEERYAKRIARAIVAERKREEIQTTEKLAVIVRSLVSSKGRVKSLSRIFQALRIEVNNELENLEAVLEQAVPLLKVGGRMVAISYHSLEDRMVKSFFKREESGCVCPPQFPYCVCGGKGRLRVLTPKPLRPNEVEVQSNPRARSARLRAAERIA